MYTEDVIEVSQKYCDFEPDFLSIADAVDKAYMDVVSEKNMNFPMSRK